MKDPSTVGIRVLSVIWNILQGSSTANIPLFESS